VTDVSFAPRPYCYRCDKPEFACLCAKIQRLPNRTPLVIVQHKHESRHPFGTVRIAELGLSNLRVHTVPGSAVSGPIPPSFVPEGAGLLYPGPGARELSSLAPHELPPALVVLDGTWHQARALLRDHAWLRDLPRYSLEPKEPSRYRVRREPLPTCVSTIEAIVQALTVLEPELSGQKGLLAAFDHLNDVQLLEMSQREHHARPRDRRPAEIRCLPRALVDDFDSVIVVYGEASRPEHDAEAVPELLHWTALRVRDLATFDCVVRPRHGAPSACRLEHLGLDRADLDAAVTPLELAARWSEFARPPATLLAWNPRTFAHFERAVGAKLIGVGLKGVYHRVRLEQGDLDRLVALESRLPLPEPWTRALRSVRGRARQRLENALTIARSLLPVESGPRARGAR
jgi:DTW domain-containing protein YfiP